MECVKCGNKRAVGAFCDKCGAELPEADASGIANIDPPTSNPQVSNLKSQVSDSPSYASGYMKVEHDPSRVLVVGQTMNFRFCLTPLVDGLSDVFVAVVFEGRNRRSEVRPLSWLPCKGERRELKNINFSAPESGTLGFSFYFGYKFKDEEIVFEADSEYKVWPAHSRAKDAIKNIKINIQNTGHANDYDFKGVASSIDPSQKLEDAIDHLHRIPPMWTALKLYRSNWRPPRRRRHEPRTLSPVCLDQRCPPEAHTTKLTLSTAGRRINLLTSHEIHLGRHRDNDLVTRLFDNGTATHELNAQISRYHCEISRQKKKCFVLDRSGPPGESRRPSPFGIFADGHRIHGQHQLSKKDSCLLTLAGPDATAPTVFGLELETWSCNSAMRRSCKRDCEARQISSLVLRRFDRVPETYVALWECLSLVDADPDFDGMIVWREGNGYAYATAETEGWLQPGMSIRAAQCEIRVEEWNQKGL